MSAEFRGTERYRVIRRIGTGGMGVVYEAYDRDTKARVALKTLQRADANALYRLKREFRALHNVQHPNLVTLGELVEAEGEWFFTMELVRGVDFLTYVRPRAGSLADTPPPRVSPSAATPPIELIAHEASGPDGTRLDEGRLRAVLPQLAAGVAALHAAGKVHRDIKPSNVLVTPQGRVVLLDFGLIADVLDGHESTMHAVGTATYMAPEQAASKPIGPPADWYAVGVVLYEALTGRVPFSGMGLQVLLDKQQSEPAPPRDVAADVAPDLDALCSELLAFEPAARPSAGDVLARLGAPVSVAAGSLSSSQLSHAAVFVGRERELDVLRQGFDAAMRGSPVALCVHGESGIGKSALIRELTDSLGRELDDVVVLFGRCHEREAVPYKAFDGVVDALSRHMRRMPDAEVHQLVPRHAWLLRQTFPVFGRVEAIAQTRAPARTLDDAQERRRSVFEALRELLFRLCERHAVIVVIDDVQWADGDSAQLLRELLRPPDAPPLFLLASLRGPVDATKNARGHTELATAGLTLEIPCEVRQLPLEPLDPPAARELASRLLERAGAGTVGAAWTAAEAAGHPLYIAELVRHAATGDGTGGTPVLEDAIWSRALQLAPAARHVLELTAVGGAPLPRGVVQAAARMTPAELDRQVSLLRVAHLIRGTGSRGNDVIEPYHDRVREAVLARLDDDTLRRRHARLAIALQSETEGPERPALLIRHLLGAGELDAAAACARTAAARAQDALAFDRAAELFRAALELGTHDREASRELQLGVAHSLVNAGRGAEAAEMFVAAGEGADPVTQRDCHRQAAMQWFASGHIERGLEAINALLAELGGTLKGKRRTIASLAWQRAKLRARGLRWTPRSEHQITRDEVTRLEVYEAVARGLAVVDPLRAADFHTRWLLQALRCGDSRRIVQGIVIESAFAAGQGPRKHARAKRLAQRAKRAASRAQLRDMDGWLASADGAVLYFAGRFGPAASAFHRAQQELRHHRTGATTHEYYMALGFHLVALRQIGDMTELRRRIDENLNRAMQRGDWLIETTIRRYLNIVWLALHGADAARSELAAATWMPPGEVFHNQHWYELLALGEIALYEGRVAEMWPELEPSFARFSDSLLSRQLMQWTMERWLRGRLLLSAARDEGGEPRSILRRVDRLASALARKRVPYATAYSHLLRAGVELRSDNRQAAVHLVRLGISSADECDMLLLAAAARWRLGQLLGGDEGRQLIAVADRWMSEQGIREPARMLEVYAPGFAPGSPRA